MEWERKNLRKKVKNFIKEKIKVNVEVKYARKIGARNIIIVKIGTFEQKISIIEKNILEQEEIYIENDKTKKKREIQRKIVKIVKTERKKHRFKNKSLKGKNKWNTV